MRRNTSVLASITCILTVVVTADEPSGQFQGEWRTTIGLVKLDQKGDAVTGTYGPGDKFPLKGSVKNNTLTFEYEEGQAKGDGRFTLDSTGNAFTGGFQIRNGQSGYWNGWRPDAKAPIDKPGGYSGLWLTDLGLMELTQDGAKVSGHYALRGTSKLDGEINGRRLNFHFDSFRHGLGWFDLTTDGKSFAGAGNTDGFAGWFGWKGQPAPKFKRHVPLIAGKMVDGSTKTLLTYCIRAPEDYQPGSNRKWPAVLILHGSNMNGQSYVSTIEAVWPEIARDFILLGINGETPSNVGDDPRFNYSYVNYVGRSTYKGFPGTDRESPALVSEAMAELKEVYPISHFLVGGHSQGGFLTYSLLMNFPESMAGAFPISCGVIFQCEPDAYDDDNLRKAQRAVPLAIVHGKTDPIVGFRMGEYAATLFGEASWATFRFLPDDTAGHMFGRLPIAAAIRWLESHASSDPVSLIDLAASQLARKDYRDAISTIRRVRTLNIDDNQKRRLEELSRLIDTQASVGIAKYLPLIRQAKDGSWIDEFLTFRDDFEFADAADEVMAAFTELRGRHKDPAKKAFGEARQLFQQGKQDDGYAKYREIVEKYYAAPLYRNVKQWLQDRK